MTTISPTDLEIHRSEKPPTTPFLERLKEKGYYLIPGNTIRLYSPDKEQILKAPTFEELVKNIPRCQHLKEQFKFQAK